MPNSGNPEELFIRLYLDRHVIVRLADDLMERGYDVLTTQQATLDVGPFRLASRALRVTV